MPRFLDRLPLHAWIPLTSLAALPLWSVSLPGVLSDPGLPGPPRRARAQRWVIDTRFTGEAYAWRHPLLEVGVDPDALRLGSTLLTPVGGAPQPFPLRDADLWLFSNLPALQSQPWRLELDEGIAVRDVAASPAPRSTAPCSACAPWSQADSGCGRISATTPSPCGRPAGGTPACRLAYGGLCPASLPGPRRGPALEAGVASDSQRAAPSNQRDRRAGQKSVNGLASFARRFGTAG